MDAYAQTSDMTSQLVIVYDGIATDDRALPEYHMTTRPSSGFMPLAPRGATFNYFGNSADCATSVYALDFF